MANIGITESGGLFTINLDANHWTGLTVNGVTISPNHNGFIYPQTSPRSLRFVATANIDIVNPDVCFDLSDPKTPLNTYTCMIVYSPLGSEPATLNGLLSTESGSFGNQGPFRFSQNGMTGAFSVQ
jgi:hypothetical protein